MYNQVRVLFIGIVLVAGLAGCGGGETGSAASDAGTAETTNANGLTAAEMEHGIGPIKEFTPGAIDESLAATGKAAFDLKCSACHKIDQRYVGPALGDVTTHRSPAYIMNMILNPEEMTKRHPEARKLLAEYAAPMANQNLTQDEARAVLEYLRTVAP
jgi:mono/diheme cytochrome c family protein